MGSKSAKSTTKMVYPPGTETARYMALAEAARRVSGQESDIDRLEDQRAKDEALKAALIERERILRDYGRMPGVAGSERHAELRRVQDILATNQATIGVNARIARRSGGLAALTALGNAPGQQVTETEGGEEGWGGSLVKAGVLAATTYFTAGAGTAAVAGATSLAGDAAQKATAPKPSGTATRPVQAGQPGIGTAGTSLTGAAPAGMQPGVSSVPYMSSAQFSPEIWRQVRQPLPTVGPY